MFGWGESHDAYQQCYDGDSPNESSVSHELLAGGASFAAFKMFEDRQRAEGMHIRCTLLHMTRNANLD